jgi:MoaA/NifB/PqqE/SkfB family radical SAM enzyme
MKKQKTNQILKGFPQYYNHKEENPTYLGIHLSPLCNFRCEKCFIGSQKKLIGFKEKLSLQEIYKIMRSGKKHNVKAFGLTGAGEPFLDVRIKEIVNYSKKLGFLTYIATNASMLDKDILFFLKKKDVTLILSLDSLDSKKFITQTNTNKNVYKKVVENILLAQEVYKDTKIINTKKNLEIYRLAIHMTISKKNIEDIPEIKKIIKKDTLFSISPLANEGYAKKYFKKEEYLKDLKSEEHIVKIKDSITGQNICGFFRHGIDINFDGQLLLDAHAIESRVVFSNIRDFNYDILKAHNYLKPIKLEFIKNYLDGFCPVRSKGFKKWIENKKGGEISL